MLLGMKSRSGRSRLTLSMSIIAAFLSTLFEVALSLEVVQHANLGEHRRLCQDQGQVDLCIGTAVVERLNGIFCRLPTCVGDRLYVGKHPRGYPPLGGEPGDGRSGRSFDVPPHVGSVFGRTEGRPVITKGVLAHSTYSGCGYSGASARVMKPMSSSAAAISRTVRAPGSASMLATASAYQLASFCSLIQRRSG